MKYLIILLMLTSCNAEKENDKNDRVFNRLDDWLVSCMENDSSPEGITVCQTQYFGIISLCIYNGHPDIECLKLRLKSKSKKPESEEE